MESPANTLAVPTARTGDTTFYFEPSVPAWVLLALSILLIASVARSYGRTTRPIGTERKVVLGFLRAVAFLTVLLCLARPTQVTHGEIREKGLCFIAIDTSS